MDCANVVPLVVLAMKVAIVKVVIVQITSV
jgi:hypothetical protein